MNRRTWTVLVAVLCLVAAGWEVFHRLPGLVVMPSAMLTGAVALAVYAGLIGAVIRFADRWRTLRTGPVLTALGWGGLIAGVAAMSANGDLHTVVDGVLGTDTTAGRWASPLVAPLVEETLKGLGVLAAIAVARHRLTGPLEAMLLGAVSGLGFQLTENVAYLHDAGLNDPDTDSAGVLTTLGSRLPGGIDGHWLYSALVGLAIGLLLTRTGCPAARRAAAAALLVVPVVLHWANNAGPLLPSALAPDTYLVLILVGFAAVTMIAARVQTRRSLLVFHDEPGTVSTEDERLDLRSRRTAHAARRTVTRAYGRHAGRARRRLQTAQIDLATARLGGESPESAAAVVGEVRTTSGCTNNRA